MTDYSPRSPQPLKRFPDSLFSMERVKQRSSIENSLEKALGGISLSEARKLIACNNLQLEEITGCLAQLATVVNPAKIEATMLYPGSGPDLLTPLLVGNPSKVIMVEMEPVEEDLRSFPPYINDSQLSKGELVFYHGQDFMRRYIKEIFPRGFTFIGELGGNLFPFIAAQLLLAGVDLRNVAFKSEPPFKRFSFRWAHPSDYSPRDREIIVANKPSGPALEAIAKAEGGLKAKFDIVLSKAGMSMPEILEYHAEVLKGGGFLIIDSKADSAWPGNLSAKGCYAEVPLPEKFKSDLSALRPAGYVFGYNKKGEDVMVLRKQSCAAAAKV